MTDETWEFYQKILDENFKDTITGKMRDKFLDRNFVERKSKAELEKDLEEGKISFKEYNNLTKKGTTDSEHWRIGDPYYNVTMKNINKILQENGYEKVFSGID